MVDLGNLYLYKVRLIRTRKKIKKYPEPQVHQKDGRAPARLVEKMKREQA